MGNSAGLQFGIRFLGTKLVEALSRLIGISEKVLALMIVGLLQLGPGVLAQEIDQSCVISVLNRTAPVEADGTWVLPNIPAGTGPVVLRATCIRDGVVSSGESEPIVMPADGIVQVSSIRFVGEALGPERLFLSRPGEPFTFVGQTMACLATAAFADGTAKDVSGPAAGTTYTSSNPAILSVEDGCLLTAMGSGTAIISGLHQGALGLLSFSITLSGDTDGDGLPDDWEIANGLDPNEPGDALLDPDGDGLSTLEEFQRGLDPFNGDTDGDGLADGEEVVTWGTNPLLFDTDGDGLSDGLEIRTGSDPLDAGSFNLAAALESISVAPEGFVLYFNAVLGEASRQLVVTGNLIDGTALDITSSFYGTTYSSSDLQIANFGLDAGRVYAGLDGAAEILVSNSGFEANSQAEVVNFSPTALSYLRLDGQPRALARAGRTLYAAMDRGGLQAVDVADPEAPFVRSKLYPRAAGSTESSAARDVAVLGDRVYVAAAAAGLVVADASNPAEVRQLAAANPTGMQALAVDVAEGLAFVGSADGLVIFDISDAEAPALLGTVALPAPVQDVKAGDGVVWVALGASGLRIVDVRDPGQPRLAGKTFTRPNDSARSSGLALIGATAVVADGGSPRSLGGLAVVDGSDTSLPVVVGRTSDEFGLVRVAVDEFGLALAADYYFVNSVPIFRWGGGSPFFAATLDFSGPPLFRQDDGVDLVVDRGLVYLLSRHWYWGNGGLQIGRYLLPNDTAGVGPEVRISSPTAESRVRERRRILVTAEAQDDIRVRSVEIFADGKSLAVDFDRPFQAEVVVPDGQQTVALSAAARDGAGNVGTSEVVEVPIEEDPSPSVALRAPRDGETFAEGVTVRLRAEASDDTAVARVEFYVEAELLSTDFDPIYGATFTTPQDMPELLLTARAYDDQGQMTESAPVRIFILQDASPAVALVAPKGDAQVAAGTVLRLIAAATDDVGVERVSFYENGVVTEIDLAGPPWEGNYMVLAAGTEVSLTAVARDSNGQETTSEVVNLVSVPDPRTTVTGLVVEASGSGVGGATATVRTEAGTASEGITASDGSFEVSGLATNEGLLRVSASESSGGVTRVASLVEPLAPAPSSTVDAGVLVLKVPSGPTTTVVGQVEDSAGHPVAGALVRVHNRWQKRETLSLPDGSFRLEGMPATRVDGSTAVLHVAVFADLGGVVQRGRRTFPLGPVAGGESVAGTLRLGAVPASDLGTEARGRVVEGLDAGLANATVAISTDFDLYATVTDAEGGYSLAGVSAKEGRLFATAEALWQGQLTTAQGTFSTPVEGGVTEMEDVTIGPDGCDGPCLARRSEPQTAVD